MPQDVKALAIPALIAIFVGLAAYGFASAGTSELRSQIANLSAQVQALQASQASVDQRLNDGDLQQKASALRIDEVAGRVDVLEKTLAPPAPPAAAIEPAPVAPTAPEPAKAQ